MPSPRLERPDISLAQRISIAVELIASGFVYGRVSEIARSLEISRQTVYDFVAGAVLNLTLLVGERPTPLFSKGTDEELVFTAQLLGEPLSLDAVRELSARGLGCNRSPSFYTGFVRIAGEVSGDMLREAAQMAKHVALDETFPHDVLLTAMDPGSLTCLGVQLLGANPLNQEAWSGFLETQLPSLGSAVCDQGTALRAALGARGVPHDPDITHISARLGLARFRARKLTATAFQKFEKADAAWGKTDAARRQGLLFRDLDRSEETRHVYEKALRAAEQRMDAWTAVEHAHQFVRKAFRYTCENRLATPEEARANLEKAIELLDPHKATVREIGAAATYLRGVQTHFGGFLTRLDCELERLGPGAREAFVIVRRERQKHTQRARDEAWAALWQTDLDDDMRLEVLLRVDAEYERLLGEAARSSASVEHLHSRFAPYTAVSDRLSQARWNLVAVRLNGSVFREGKRAGSSPFGLLGLDTDQHWSQALVERMRRQFPASVEHLLTHGCLPAGWTSLSEVDLAKRASAPAARAA